VASLGRVECVLHEIVLRMEVRRSLANSSGGVWPADLKSSKITDSSEIVTVLDLPYLDAASLAREAGLSIKQSPTCAKLEFPREHHKKQPHEASNHAHNQEAR
jgi:hypothetical protein